MNRRDLLKGIFISSAMAYPIYKLINILITNDNFTSLGTPSKSSTRNYIQFNFYGGPTRWCYDNFLNPYDSNFIQNPMTFNKIQHNLPAEKQIYHTYKYRGVNIPPLWKENLYSKREMSNLLNNSLTIRGAHTEGTSGHPMNSSKTIAPSIGGLSIDGLLADESSKPITSVTVGDTPVNRAFKSKRSSSIKIKSDINNRLQYLLSPFHLATNKKEKDINIENLLDEAIVELNKSDKSKQLKSDLKRARIFFRDSIEEFIKEHDSLIKKYQKIINTSMLHPIKGIDDKPIPTVKLPITVKGNKEVLEILGPYRITNVFLLPEDLRDILKEAKIDRLAADFALAEFLSKYGLSSSIVFADKNEIGLMFDNILSNQCYRDTDINRFYDPAKNETTISTNSKFRTESPQLSFDSHTTGSVVNLLTCSKYFYTFSNCLDEFISTLKSIPLGEKTLFEETVIHVTSEFDRKPIEDLSGSDHNEQAHVSTFYSGIIEGPIVLGNVYIGSNDRSENWGTIGNSAPVDKIGSKVGISHVSSTLSCLLRIPSIVKRSPSLIKIEGNKVIPTIELAKNIGGENESYNS